MNKKYLAIIIFFLISFCFSQVGINTDNPSASLDIVSLGNSELTKALEINDVDNNETFTVYDNGNVYFKRSLLLNNSAGLNGKLIKSNGSNVSPEWVAADVDNSINKYLAVVFNGNQTSIPITYNLGNTVQRVSVDNHFLEANSVGEWNSSLNEYTVQLEGIYYVTVGVNMETQLSNSSNTGNIWIYAGGLRQGISAVLNSDNNRQLSAAGVLTAYLFPGDKIYVTSTINSAWLIKNNFLNISFSNPI